MHPQHEGPAEGRDTHSKEGQPGVDYRRHPPRTDPTLQHPRCVFQILKRHYARYTPGNGGRDLRLHRRIKFERVAEALWRTRDASEPRPSPTRSAGPSTPSACSTSARPGIVQALLGNIGRPGGGILALRGHATIQGSTDIATLYNLLPGYLTAPSAQLPEHDTLDGWVDHEMPTTGWWANGRKYMVSLLKAWYGDAATRENEWGYQFLPKNVGDHSHMPMFIAMHEGVVKGFIAMGQNPAVGGQNAVYPARRPGEAGLDGGARPLPDRDRRVLEGARRARTRAQIQTEVFFLPGGHGARDGRLVHQHAAAGAVARQGDRSAGGLPERHLVHPSPGQAAEGAVRGLDQPERCRLPRADLGLRGGGPYARASGA